MVSTIDENLVIKRKQKASQIINRAVLAESEDSFKSLLHYHLLQVDDLLEYYHGDNRSPIARTIETLSHCLKSRKKIILVGCGKSLKIAMKINATLHSMGLASIYLHPTEAMHGDIGVVNEGDCLMACSSSGETEEIINLLNYLTTRGGWRQRNGKDITLISVCGNANSTIAQMCDELVLVPQKYSESEIQNGLKAPTLSTTSMLIVLDCLCVALSQVYYDGDLSKRNAVFNVMHPGGCIGKNTSRLENGKHSAVSPFVGKIRREMTELEVLQTLVVYDWIEWEGQKKLPSKILQIRYKLWKQQNLTAPLGNSFTNYLAEQL